jgi:rare lipoprotein A (peptidoglycan hydrolase)
VSVAAIVMATSGCSLFRMRPAPPPVEGGVQVGVASWYGPGFHGRPTASGEIFDQHALTAAHPSLALGTRARVTSLANDRSVEVRINDRGPFVGGRIVDLSRAAAERIHMIGPGVMRVRLDVLDVPSERPVRPVRTARPGATPPIHGQRPSRREPVRRERPPPAPPPVLDETGWVVESAAFRERATAEEAHRAIARRFPDAYVTPVAGSAPESFGVRLGPYEARRSAEARAEIVERLGYPAAVLGVQAP